MLDPVKEDTFQRGTAQHTIAPINPMTPRATQTIWTPADPILGGDKREKTGAGEKVSRGDKRSFDGSCWILLRLKHLI